ncbi:isochorismatase family protein [Variovorax sp. PCZ-1]|uniref:isochorismatase family protein n=1 Tax=Variovorax sp. PCZ-1 TaxID=2835533 RepID=UPI001BCF45A0|nr:isochorismatase family protein [Variovorax sp. PCZ-1]MBS7806767.1 isochorismatase family protein [Variovorax sp. PCZ-1]
MLIDTSASQLVLIDLQAKLMPAMHESSFVLQNAVRLAQAARLMRVPVTVTEQYPEGLGETVPELADFAREPLVKTEFSAVDAGLIEVLQEIGTPKASPNLKSVPKHLQKAPTNNRTDIIIAGCEAHVCVLQTVMGLLEDFDVYVVTDACSSRTERNRDAAYDRIAAEGASLVTTEMVLFEWLRGSEHAQFKAVQGLIKV